MPLPRPVQTDSIQSGKLCRHIQKLITQSGGSISFEQYMSACLYQPALGYYNTDGDRIGEAGDFITAPEVSSLFSKCLANQCTEILNQTDGDIILELGAGTGRMACDILQALEKQDTLPKEYWILELSAALRKQQQVFLGETIPHLYPYIRWFETLPKKTFTGVILGNEILDALPFCRFIKMATSFHEIRVGFDKRGFVWKETPADSSLLDALKRIDASLKRPLPDTYISELNRRVEDWLNMLQKSLKRGVMLFIDYGFSGDDYYHPEQSGGRLLCHYRHHAHADPFYYPGLQDITAPVDFTAVANAACALGLDISGYTTQTCFLLANGLENLITATHSMDIKVQTQTAQQVRMLTMPDQMGERFKVIALSKKHDQPLSGFSMMNGRLRL